jgi:hypothetical protein
MNWKLKSGESVVDRQRSHAHDGVQPLLSEVFEKINSEGRGFIVATVDLGRIVGNQTRVETRDGDEIVFAQRVGRFGLTRFVKNRRAEPCSSVTVILKKGDRGEYILITAWVGTQSEPEPWDRNATARSVPFWNASALIWGSEAIIAGTETTQCPW